MKSFNLKAGVGRVVMTLSLLLGIGIISSVTAQAQTRDGRWQRRDSNRVQTQTPNRDWHRDGDRERVRRDDRYERNNVYGNYGRGPVYGNNGVYGRSPVYGNYGGYGNQGVYNNSNQVAANQGYQAGLSTGASDAQRGQSYDPQRSHYFREASSQQFRNGFVQGYDQGYRQYAGYGNYGGYGRGSTGNVLGSILGGVFGRP
jgi:hypothetical protein